MDKLTCLDTNCSYNKNKECTDLDRFNDCHSLELERERQSKSRDDDYER